MNKYRLIEGKRKGTKPAKEEKELQLLDGVSFVSWKEGATCKK